MSTLNFPTNPTLNQLYSFGGKTWIWTGQAWRLNPQGAINGIVIGNTAPAAGTFTTLTANTLVVNNETVYANLAVGNLAVSNVSVAGNVNSALNVRGNVTGTNVITGGSVSAGGPITALGNVSGSYFIGNGRQLTGIVASTGSFIVNGTSNVTIPEPNGNIFVSVNSTPNVAVFADNQITVGVNVVPSSSNVTLGTLATPFEEGYFSGNSVWVGNAKLTANATTITIVNPEGGEFTFSGNTNYSPYSNANVAAYLTTYAGNISANEIVANTITASDFYGNLHGNISGNITTDSISVSGNISAGGYFVGDGSQLANVMADRGSDQADWNAITQMGTYTVNRASWSGTVGTPLDSQVYVGLLEVKNSTDTALEQVFYPGTVDLTNAKVQWNRNYWSGSWTPWIKIINDYQVMQGGEF